MNLTIYNPSNRSQKYTIHYRPSCDQVIEGTFTIINEQNKKIKVNEEQLYNFIHEGIGFWFGNENK